MISRDAYGILKTRARPTARPGSDNYEPATQQPHATDPFITNCPSNIIFPKVCKSLNAFLFSSWIVIVMLIVLDGIDEA